MKLTVVERYQSNRLFGYMVVAFRLMQEQKYVCGKQPKIVNLQHLYYKKTISWMIHKVLFGIIYLFYLLGIFRCGFRGHFWGWELMKK